MMNWNSSIWFFIIIGAGVLFIIAIILIYTLIRKNTLNNSNKFPYYPKRPTDVKFNTEAPVSLDSMQFSNFEKIQDKKVNFCSSCGNKVEKWPSYYCAYCGNKI